ADRGLADRLGEGGHRHARGNPEEALGRPRALRGDAHPAIAGVTRRVGEVDGAIGSHELESLRPGRGGAQDYRGYSGQQDEGTAHAAILVGRAFGLKEQRTNSALFDSYSIAGAGRGDAAPRPSRATRSTSSIESARCTLITSRTSDGTSSRRFFSFLRGRTRVRTPARCAARTFSLMPPTGSTRPDRLISPVIARPLPTVWLVSSETRAVAMVTPADGPSFGIAPAGTCTWMS